MKPWKITAIALVVICGTLGVLRLAGYRSGPGPINWRSSAVAPLVEAADDVQDSVARAFKNATEDPTLSPFEAVEWCADGKPDVQVEGVWYELLAINGWEINQILKFTEREFRVDRVHKRFEEDLVEVMRRSGHRLESEKVTLRVRPRSGGEERDLVATATEENRRKLWRANLERENQAGPGAAASPPALAKSSQGAAELAELLATRDAYVVATGAADKLRQLAADFTKSNLAPNPDQLTLLAQRLIGATIDGHARLEAPIPLDRGTWIGVLLHPLGDQPGTGIIAIKSDRSGPLHPSAPYIMEIAGTPIEDLITRASDYITDGSPALVRERACRLLRSTAAASTQPTTKDVQISLAPSPTAPRDQWVSISLTPTRSKPTYGQWPPTNPARPHPGIAYVRLLDMNDDAQTLATLKASLNDAASSPALIIDVRGNGGGSRDAMMLVASMLMNPAQGPVVYNVARALRLPDEDDRVIDRRMASRFLRRSADAAWTPQEQAAIEKFAVAFKVQEPNLTFDDARFGPWYYGVLSPDAAGNIWRADRRVLVLMDNVCFSATDVFLTAMRRIGVPLMGRPSAGGSGLLRPHRAAGLEMRLSSMVSFTYEGWLFDGRGITPDAIVWPTPEDFVTGGTDITLDAAVKHLAVP